MTERRTHIELLAPAGNPVALNAAVRAGADAIYLGMESFNARRNADNFNDEKLAQACDYAHLRGARIYVTLNTVILPHEIDQAIDSARRAYEAGADACIVQDIGLASALSELFPAMELHISTQMNLHSLAGIRAAARLGASRVTLARELSLEEISELSAEAANLGMEVEVFAHGALCVCYSGQCYLSSLIGGRSANRGMCAQACRLPYALLHGTSEVKTPGEHLLSPKDLCTIDLLPQLIDAGVGSLKIEGRMKSPEYVFSVVGTYRKVLDELERTGVLNVYPEDRQRLDEAFSRGFTQGYLTGERGNDLMSYTRPNNRGISVGRISSIKGDEIEIQTTRTLNPKDVLEIWTRKGNTTLVLEGSFAQQGKVARVHLDKASSLVKVGDRVFRVRNGETSFAEDAHEPRIPVDGTIEVREGKPLGVSFTLAQAAPLEQNADRALLDNVEQDLLVRLHEEFPIEMPVGRAEGALVEQARTKALSIEDVRSHIDRLGSTPYTIENLRIDLSEGVGLGFSALHHVRAEALDNLTEELLKPWRSRPAAPRISPIRSRKTATDNSSVVASAQIAVWATNPDCARAARRAGADLIYVPALNLVRGQAVLDGKTVYEATQAGYPKKVIPVMPVVDKEAIGLSRENLLQADFWKFAQPEKPVLVESLGDLQRAWEMDALPEVGPHLPVTNLLSMETVASYDVRRVWLSPELNLKQIQELGATREGLALGLTVIGTQELMVTEHCVLMSEGPCNERCTTCARRRQEFFLKDRKGYRFPVITDALGRSHLYNSVGLDVVHAIPDLLDAGVSLFMIDSTFMDVQEVSQAVGRVAKAIESAQQGGAPSPKPAKATTGHLFRGVA